MSEHDLADEQKQKSQHRFIFGCSPASKKMYDFAQKIAQTDHTVLLLGGSGVGKDVFARLLHDESDRSGRLVNVNCATLPEHLIDSLLFGHTGEAFTGAKHRTKGLVDSASGGTFFLDEIGEMPLSLQAKLLGVLERRAIRMLGSIVETEVNTRIIAATNTDLVTAVAQGKFRLDLYYRLSTFELTLPSLRERKEDIPALVDHFLCELESRKLCSEKTIKHMLEYDWPGNIRELKNAIVRGVVFSGERDTILPEDLHLVPTKIEELPTVHEHTRQYYASLFKRTKGDIVESARIAGVAEEELKSWMSECVFAEQFRSN